MRKLLVAGLLLVSQLGFAATWQLDNTKSGIQFTSTKNDTIQEQNQFKQLTGNIDDKGLATLQVTMSSVDTHIPLRDERMRELLFETTRYPKATVTTQIDPKVMAELNDMQPHTIPVDGTLDLHGVKHEIKTQVIAQQIDANTVQIKNAEPIVINADDYNMQVGIAALTKIVALKSISPNVPVNFTLVFKKGA